MNWTTGIVDRVCCRQTWNNRRYEIDAGKIKKELGWAPEHTFEKGIGETVRWYLSHKEWWQRIISGEDQHLLEAIF